MPLGGASVLHISATRTIVDGNGGGTEHWVIPCFENIPADYVKFTIQTEAPNDTFGVVYQVTTTALASLYSESHLHQKTFGFPNDANIVVESSDIPLTKMKLGYSLNSHLLGRYCIKGSDERYYQGIVSEQMTLFVDPDGLASEARRRQELQEEWDDISEEECVAVRAQERAEQDALEQAYIQVDFDSSDSLDGNPLTPHPERYMLPQSSACAIL